MGLVATLWLLVACAENVAPITQAPGATTAPAATAIPVEPTVTPPPAPTATATPPEPTSTPPPEPPAATLIVGGEEQTSGIGSYCWDEPTDAETSVMLCVDTMGIPTVPEPLPAGSPLTATFALPLSAAPEELVLRVFPVAEEDGQPSSGGEWVLWEPLPGEQQALSLSTQPTATLALDPGLYVLDLFARWQERGDVTYGFLLRVESTLTQGARQEVWSSLAPNGQWIAAGRATFPAEGGQYHTLLTIARPYGPVEWTVVDEWSQWGLGYTVPQAVRWSADGERFYFTNRPVPDGCAIFVNGSDLQQVDLSDGSVTEIVPSVGLALALSPGENTLAYFGYGQRGLVLRDLATGEEREIPLNLESNGAAGSIVWAPDETALAFTVGWGVCASPDQATHSIVRLDVSTRALAPLIEKDPRRLTTVDWTDDGKLWLVDPQGQYGWVDPHGSDVMELYPEEALTTLAIPEPVLQVQVPQGYALVKSDERNRRGSFVSYNFGSSEAQPPFLYELQFFSAASIVEFTSNCGGPCFYGDYPDLTRYAGQKAAFEAGRDFEYFRLRRFGERDYFVSNHRCEGALCVIREYTTFLGDVKVDVWIMMDDTTQSAESDRLFSAFAIEP